MDFGEQVEENFKVKFGELLYFIEKAASEEESTEILILLMRELHDMVDEILTRFERNPKLLRIK